MSDTRGEYTSVPQHDGHPTSAPNADAPPSAHAKSFTERLIRRTILFIAACTVIDTLALSYLAFLFLHRTLFPPDCAAPLALRSSYVNFDRLYGASGALRAAPHAPIVNHVLALAHISRARPHDAVTRAPGGAMTVNGYVPLDARRLWVTDDVSTVVQFRAIDYGMENCSVALVSAAMDVELDVWALADDTAPPGRRLLDPRTLTWASRPERKAHVGVLRVAAAAADGASGETRTFACPSGSYHTLEIACASMHRCDVDILGVGHGASGVYVKQYQTI